jgi:hypothetical protein
MDAPPVQKPNRAEQLLHHLYLKFGQLIVQKRCRIMTPESSESKYKRSTWVKFPFPDSQFNIEMIDYEPLLKELKFWKQQPTLQPLIVDIYLDLSRLSPSLVSYLYSSSPGELQNSLPRYILLEKWTLDVSYSFNAHML